METIIINGQEYAKNVELINSIGFINAYCLINRFEYNIQTITDIKMVLNVESKKVKQEIDSILEQNDNDINNMFEWTYDNYEAKCEYWSCLGLDLEKIN